MTVVTRFAPSPTGSLHVGGARTALYCLLHAHHHGGRFLLRIEDTDQVRSSDEATAGILRDLRWLGLAWDEGPERDLGRGPYLQSQRLALYRQIRDELMLRDLAYEAWESKAELEGLRKEAEAHKQDFRYRRRYYTPDEVARYREEGRIPVIRLMAPAHDIVMEDDILGEVTVARDHLEDIVIFKGDGFPTYHFAVVVDDHYMEVTQILRGQEHLMNTPKHLGLYEALGWTSCRFGHLPLIFNPQGTKMSKRDKARTARDGAREAHKRGGYEGWTWLAEATHLPVSDIVAFMDHKLDVIATAEAIGLALGVTLPMIEVMDFRKGGYIPEALLNYLALLGWSPKQDVGQPERELYSLAELIERWDVGRVGKTASKFDPEKLKWMNGEYLRSLPEEVLEARLAAWAEVVDSELMGLDPDFRRRVIALYRPRAQTFVELEAAARWMWTPPTRFDEKAVQKWVIKPGASPLLRAARDRLAAGGWSEAALESGLEAVAAQAGVKIGAIAQPIRVAISGAAATPGLFETLAALDQADVIRRLDRALSAWEAP